MKIKINMPNTLPRNWKGLGLSSMAWEDLNGGKAIEVDSIPSGYELLVTEVKAEGASSSVGTKSSAKKGAK